MNKRQRRFLDGTVRYAVLLTWLAVVSFPIFWMVSTSFKPEAEWFAWPPPR